MAASALPVGMLSPHVTRSPTPLSRLTALGVPLARSELAAAVPAGQGWQACEVDNLGADAGRWPAALVRPAALVQAWLDEARMRTTLVCHWSARAAAIARAELPDGRVTWRVADPDGRTVAQAPTVVVAAALGSLELVASPGPSDAASSFPLHPVKGQLSLAALQGPPLAPRPRRDQGVFVPSYEDSGLPPRWPARLWAMGSTYERGQDNRALSAAAHLQNADSLGRLQPAAGKHMREELAAGRLLGWAEVRCASLDRLPLVGPLPDLDAFRRTNRGPAPGQRRPALREVPRLPGLYMLCALGSRGLSLAALCGRLLVEQIESAPTDIPADLVAALDPARFAWRQARRQPVRPP